MVRTWPYWIVRRPGLYVALGCAVLALLVLDMTWRGQGLLAPVSVETRVGLLVLLTGGLALAAQGKKVEGTLILGTGELAEKLYRVVLSGKALWKTENVLESSPHLTGRLRTPGALFNYEELQQLTPLQGISRIVLAESTAEGREKAASALIPLKLSGVAIEDAVDVYERLTGKIWLEGLHPDWLIYSDGFQPSSFYLSLKRFMDLAGTLAILLVFGPLMLLIAVAIRLNSRGPVLHRQTRVGLQGEQFTVYKFRSMREDAERNSGPAWAKAGDTRVTSVGKILRKYHLDELPQLFNVLRGEMSLIGPRPERPVFVELLRKQIPYYDLRHFMKPGLTGWAQVMYPYAASIEDTYEKLQYDLYYGKHMSFSYDLLIMLKTAAAVLRGDGR